MISAKFNLLGPWHNPLICIINFFFMTGRHINKSKLGRVDWKWIGNTGLFSFFFFTGERGGDRRLFHRCYYNLHRVVFLFGLFFLYGYGFFFFFTGVSQTRALVLCSFWDFLFFFPPLAYFFPRHLYTSLFVLPRIVGERYWGWLVGFDDGATIGFGDERLIRTAR